MPTREEIKDRLQPKHLEIPEIHALQEAIASEVEGIEEKAPVEDPRAQREYPFEFNWKSGSGKVWKGSFTNKILSIRDRQMVGILRARLANNTPIEALDELTREINLMVAHMSYSLTQRPDWAKDMQGIDDVRLLQELYTEVANHESTFLGYGTLTTPG